MNIDGLSSLLSIGFALEIEGNFNLTECCGIYPLLAYGPGGENVSL